MWHYYVRKFILINKKPIPYFIWIAFNRNCSILNKRRMVLFLYNYKFDSEKGSTRLWNSKFCKMTNQHKIKSVRLSVKFNFRQDNLIDLKCPLSQWTSFWRSLWNDTLIIMLYSFPPLVLISLAVDTRNGTQL